MEERNPCIAMVPCPGFGHLIPVVELAKRLVLHHPHFHVTLFIPTLGPPSANMFSILQSLPPHIDFTILPHVNLNDMPQTAVHPATQIRQTVSLSLPSLHHALSSLNSRTHFVAMIADLFAVDALEIAKQFNLTSYIYYASGATSLCFCLNLPALDKDHDMVPTGFRELSQPLKLPGCIVFNGKDLPDLVQERSSECYGTILHICERFNIADGIIVNSFLELEREVITTLLENNHKYPPVYPLGPIIQTELANINEPASKCLTWLDNQPRNSVLYVSFGSGGTLSRDQLHELALGLEMSGHKFLWVVRPPSGFSCSDYLSAQKEGPLDYLPKGFISRTKGQGLVVPSWAPQIEVLRHVSTGGFLTHCGWNSTLESIFYGKPMIAWPLFAEQRMNAVLVTEELKIAVWLKKENENNNDDDDGIVEKEEISRVVKSLMDGDEGKEMSRRIKVFKDASVKAFGDDGTSMKTLNSLAFEILN